MLTTEAEAKSKRCQEAISAQAPEAEVADALRCIGPACMAWRWAFTASLIGNVEQTDRGYCGKAGPATGIIDT